MISPQVSSPPPASFGVDNLEAETKVAAPPSPAAPPPKVTPVAVEMCVDAPPPPGVNGDVGGVVIAPPSPPLQVAVGEGKTAEEDGEFICDICHAVYQSEKAMFGHLRCHRSRGWRGAYCPPTFSMEEFSEYQEHLVKPMEEQLREIRAEQSPVTEEEVVEPLDLNLLPPEAEAEAEMEEEKSEIPDLNLPPPNEAC